MHSALLERSTIRFLLKCEVWRTKNTVFGAEIRITLAFHFKPLTAAFWSVRVGIYYRAVGFVEDDEITWVWIGHPSEYDGFIRGLGR